MALKIIKENPYTAKELAEAVMHDEFEQVGIFKSGDQVSKMSPIRFDEELYRMSPHEREAFIQMSVSEPGLRQKVDRVIQETYEDDVISSYDIFDQFISERNQALEKYRSELKELNRDPSFHLLACDSSTYLGRVHSEEAFCEDADEREFYRTSVTEIIDEIYARLPHEIIQQYDLCKENIPRDMVEVMVIKGQWNVDFLERVSYSKTQDGRINISLVFSDETTDERGFYAFTI